MNTRKTIYDKLFTEKVELAKHEVELALIDDIKKLMNSALSRKAEFQKFAQTVQQQLDNLRVSSNMWNRDLSEAQTLISNLVVKAKEIGVAVPNEVLAYEKIIKEGVSETKNYSNIVAKIKSELPKG
jgi:phage shock protein A